MISCLPVCAWNRNAKEKIMCQDHHPHPSPRAFFTNLQGPEPWTTKLRLLLRNNWLKLRTFKNCCGHPGEPGC